MLNIPNKLLHINSEKTIKFLNSVFFLFSFIEIYAEFTENIFLKWFTKPFLIPILLFLYYFSSKEKSKLYITALFFSWLANVFFMFTEINFIIMASGSFLLHRILIIYKIFKNEKPLDLIPIILGGIPFLFFFLSLMSMVYENIAGGQFYLILCQTILMTILGGFSIGNYIIKNTNSSKMLLISSLFFAINLFIFGIKIYYIDLQFLKPMSMIFFVMGQYLLYYFIILKEKS